jgi:excisionase family DNA binding protein
MDHGFVTSVSPLLTPEELASIIKVSRRALYSMCDRGEVPGIIRIGRRLRFDAQLIRIWLDESRASSPKE